MSEQTPESGSGPLSLPDEPNLDWLRKQAKRWLEKLRQANQGAMAVKAVLGRHRPDDMAPGADQKTA